MNATAKIAVTLLARNQVSGTLVAIILMDLCIDR